MWTADVDRVLLAVEGGKITPRPWKLEKHAESRGLRSDEYSSVVLLAPEVPSTSKWCPRNQAIVIVIIWPWVGPSIQGHLRRGCENLEWGLRGGQHGGTRGCHDQGSVHYPPLTEYSD